MNKVYVALGSNLANPQAQLISALQAMNQLSGSRLVAVSSFYQSKPLGPQDLVSPLDISTDRFPNCTVK